MEKKQIEPNVSRKRSSTNIQESVLNKIRDNPNGIRFLELQNAFELSPSVLSRNLKILELELRVFKEGNLYRPSDADISKSFLVRIIEVVDHYLSSREGRQAGKDGDEKKLKIALIELLPVSGHPANYDYEKLIEDSQALSLLNLLEYFADDGKEFGSEFREPLSQFIENFVRFRIGNGKTRLNRPLESSLEHVEEDIFRNAVSGENKIDLLQRSGWLSVYRSLIAVKSKRIWEVFARLILSGECEQASKKREDLYLQPNKMDKQELSSLSQLIHGMTSDNDLPNDYATEVLHLMAPKIFDCEFKCAEKYEEYVLFLQDLRKTIELRYNDKHRKMQ